MRVRRRIAAAVLLAGFSTLLLSAAVPAMAASGAPPFCVKRGGPKGPDDFPLICRFSNYQDCLDAAAELHGYCVANMDYKGTAPSAPPQPRTRREK